MDVKVPMREFTPIERLHNVQALKTRTRIIGGLKYSLPGIALAALGALVAWPQLQKWQTLRKPALSQRAPTHRESNTAIRPEYKSMDDKGQLYTITADYGVEASVNEVDLTAPKMVMSLKSGDVVTLSSDSGKLNKETNEIYLVGNVTLTHSQGYNLITTRAWVDGKQRTAYGDKPVQGSGPAGSIKAEGFRLMEGGAKVHFSGRPQLLIQSEEGKKK